MSKKSNVNPDHSKTAGGEPQGQDPVRVERQPFAEAKIREKRGDPLTAERDLAAQPGYGRSPGCVEQERKTLECAEDGLRAEQLRHHTGSESSGRSFWKNASREVTYKGWSSISTGRLYDPDCSLEVFEIDPEAVGEVAVDYDLSLY